MQEFLEISKSALRSRNRRNRAYQDNQAYVVENNAVTTIVIKPIIWILFFFFFSFSLLFIFLSLMVTSLLFAFLIRDNFSVNFSFLLDCWRWTAVELSKIKHRSYSCMYIWLNIVSLWMKIIQHVIYPLLEYLFVFLGCFLRCSIFRWSFC